MGKRLNDMFDFQRFCNNEKLNSVIVSTEEKYSSAEISDDDLELVSAAGETGIILY